MYFFNSGRRENTNKLEKVPFNGEKRVFDSVSPIFHYLEDMILSRHWVHIFSIFSFFPLYLNTNVDIIVKKS
jgi:hypothetical protein